MRSFAAKISAHCRARGRSPSSAIQRLLSAPVTAGFSPTPSPFRTNAASAAPSANGATRSTFAPTLR